MGKIKYVLVQFKESKESEYRGYKFTFRCPESMEIKENDLVLCDTKYGISLGKVAELTDTCSKMFKDKQLRSIIQVVDLTEYKERLAIEERMNTLRRQMNERMEQLKDLELIRMMSENDPELKRMLDEYMRLEREDD